MVDKFNIRVYGLLLKSNKILVSEEMINGFFMIKLPGGGLELGEGIAEGLKRELSEELGITINKADHIYTTDIFVQSKFKQNEQVIAIYYQVHSAETISQFNITQESNLGAPIDLHFVWKELNEDLIDLMSFETDKTALRLLIQRINGSF